MTKETYLARLQHIKETEPSKLKRYNNIEEVNFPVLSLADSNKLL